MIRITKKEIDSVIVSMIFFSVAILMYCLLKDNLIILLALVIPYILGVFFVRKMSKELESKNVSKNEIEKKSTFQRFSVGIVAYGVGTYLAKTSSKNLSQEAVRTIFVALCFVLPYWLLLSVMIKLYQKKK